MDDNSTPHPSLGNSPVPGTPLRRRWPIINSVNALRVMSTLTIVFAIYVVVDAVMLKRQQRAVCDRMVATLLETQDLVELTRAVALTGLLRCNVSRRMPAPE